jgi:hypothetical protein
MFKSQLFRLEFHLIQYCGLKYAVYVIDSVLFSYTKIVERLEGYCIHIFSFNYLTISFAKVIT